MSHQLNPIQASQNLQPVTDVPAAIGFLGLPQDVHHQILQRIWTPLDVANLNLVSKSIKALNQHSGAIVNARIQALFTEGMYGFLVLNVGANPVGDSYQDYVRAYNDSRGQVLRKFYYALPRDMESELRRTMWETNGRSDNGHGIAFASIMILSEPYSLLVRTALRQYLSNFGVDTSINS